MKNEGSSGDADENAGKQASGAEYDTGVRGTAQGIQHLGLGEGAGGPKIGSSAEHEGDFRWPDYRWSDGPIVAALHYIDENKWVIE